MALRVIIMGYGVVGRATHSNLGVNNRVDVYDPPQGYNSSTKEIDIAIVCTPCLDGKVDVIEDIKKFTPTPRDIVVRSTVTPGALEELAVEFPESVIHFWPEFLSEDTAMEDAQNPDKKVWGCDDNARGIEVKNALLHYRCSKDFNITSLTAAALAKLAINTYYTMKVTFYNALFEAADRNSEVYDDVISLIRQDKRITVTHEVVNHKGYRGAGGKCLPKDAKNFAGHITEDNAKKFINNILEYNDHLRQSSDL